MQEESNDPIRRDRMLLERYCAVMLYKSTDGPNWQRGEMRFLSPSHHICFWGNNKNGVEFRGISCGDDLFVTEVILMNIDLAGTLPNEIYHWKATKYLRLDGNEALSGTISSAISNLSSNLLEFYISNTRISGTIPSEIGTLSNLYNLYVGNANLHGTIPTEIGNMQRLVDFVAFQNQLAGPIPSEIGGLSRLTAFVIFATLLNGTVPNEIVGSRNSLKFFEIHDTLITGSLDPIFCADFSVFPVMEQLWSDCGGRFNRVVCSCCTGCCDLAIHKCENREDITQPECMNGGCVDCDQNQLVTSCDACPFVDADGNHLADDGQAGDDSTTQLCFHACHFNQTSNQCELRTEFGI
mmetsp:Transcript_17709/g.50179  ORF Transcript_17709/g.50179 Transcript_17709/m.50179 type:complete len:353 (-) Transcript_17709:106-1164(-)